MNCHIVARSRQHFCLTDDRLRVLVTEQDECDLSHYGNGLAFEYSTVYSINGEPRLNKQTFFGFLNRLDRIKPV